MLQGLYGEDDSPVTSNRKRVSRLSMRKGRSIVHKNLEDNYGAVITANHEAIAQILEQVIQLYRLAISSFKDIIIGRIYVTNWGRKMLKMQLGTLKNIRSIFL